MSSRMRMYICTRRIVHGCEANEIGVFDVYGSRCIMRILITAHQRSLPRCPQDRIGQGASMQRKSGSSKR